MRKEKVVKIDLDAKTKKEITVYEVRPMDLFELWEKAELADEEDGNSQVSQLDLFKGALHLVSDIGAEVLELYPADQLELWEAFREINDPTLRLADLPAVEPVIRRVKELITEHFQGTFVSLFEAAMQAQSDTDLDSSSSLLEKPEKPSQSDNPILKKV